MLLIVNFHLSQRKEFKGTFQTHLSLINSQHFSMNLLFFLALVFSTPLLHHANSVSNVQLVAENPCDSIPDMNKALLAYVDASVGKKIGRGECWDFAADGLNKIGAKWDGRYRFGKEVNPKKECVYAGDVVQFEGVRVEEKTSDGIIVQSMAHHTAIIHEVYGPNRYQLVHQNFGRGGKKVGFTDLDLTNITKGKYTIFRPVK